MYKANEVQTVEGKAPNGSLAEVYDSGGNFLGKGYINRLSKILVRLFIYNREEEDTEQLFSERLIRANALRENIGLGEAYRLCFSESDGLPSLIVDRYGDVYVVEILSLGMRLKQDTIVSCLVKAFHPKCIYSRSDAPVLKKEGLEPLVGVLYGELPERVRITENGIKLDIDIVNGQKTGYYLDQKENRLALRRYAKGKTVLDCFCNVGGFLFAEYGNDRKPRKSRGYFANGFGRADLKRRIKRLQQYRNGMRRRIRIPSLRKKAR